MNIDRTEYSPEQVNSKQKYDENYKLYQKFLKSFEEPQRTFSK